MSYITSDGEVEPIFTPVTIGPGRKRATLRPGGSRSDLITVESPLPESAPDQFVHFSGGVVAMSLDTPGQAPAREHDPYFSWPVTDYALPEDYVEPFDGEMARRQFSYPPGMNTRGYVNCRKGLRQLPNYGLGSLGTVPPPAPGYEEGDAAPAPTTPPSESFASVLKAIIPSITDAGKGIYTAYAEGRAAVKQAKLTMAGETPAPMPAYQPPASTTQLPRWLLPVGATAVGLAVLWGIFR